MRRFIFPLFVLVMLVFGLPARAGVLASYTLDTAANNLTTTFSTTAPFLKTPGKGVVQVCVVNQIASDIAINVDTTSATAAPTASINDFVVPASSTRCISTDPRLKLNVYLRSDSGGTLSSGKVKYEFQDVAYGPQGN